MTVEGKLYLSRYRRCRESHIRVDQAVCNEKCTTRICAAVCPAKAYEWDDEGHMVVNHENCLECGSCRIVCPESNIKWEYPVFGGGVIYRYG